MPLSSQPGRCLFDEVNGICRIAFDLSFSALIWIEYDKKNFFAFIRTHVFTCMHFTWIIFGFEGDSNAATKPFILWKFDIEIRFKLFHISFHYGNIHVVVCFCDEKECLPEFTWFEYLDMPRTVPLNFRNALPLFSKFIRTCLRGWHFQ